ncbi:hypothetical protein [Fluviicola sp.]|uniref:hypothetical protein n=1 Tax=Fluviicola sp. TaxID=1917219 RepID=UPI003D2B50AB
MKKTLIILLIGISNGTFSQTIKEIDSVSNLMCDYLKKLKTKDDTLKISLLYQNQLSPYLGTIDESKVEKVAEQVYYRLQRNCVEFMDILNRLDPPKEETTRTNKKPKSKLTVLEIKEFTTQKKFYYFEVNGDTTNVLMENGYWTDSFSDGTFSNLTYKWISDTEFELVYIESNNETRSNFSVQGDQYIYQVLSKGADFYLMSLNIPGQETFEKFKIYYK